MVERRWSVVWVPHGSGTSRSWSVSYRALRAAASVSAVGALVALGFIYTAVRKSVDSSRLGKLEQANRLLAQEIVRTRTLLRQVNDTVASIMHQDELIRLMAGLPPNSPDVLQAGIGGPAPKPTQSEQVLASLPLGEQALQMHMDVEGMTRRANLLAASFEEAKDSLEAHQDRMRHLPSISPTRGFISSPFSKARLHPIFHDMRPHLGIDIAAPMGTPIIAPAGGLVIDINTDPEGYGKYVKIDHGYGIVTLYGHCSKILVRIGQRVERGDEIALIGDTGLSSGPHLHYEVEVHGKPVNPMTYIFPQTIVD
jgi:murein DD-endopeptidase MepM/ murein hydrolase activator NlpD